MDTMNQAMAKVGAAGKMKALNDYHHQHISARLAMST
jgi:hypothetical protein